MKGTTGGARALALAVATGLALFAQPAAGAAGGSFEARYERAVPFADLPPPGPPPGAPLRDGVPVDPYDGSPVRLNLLLPPDPDRDLRYVLTLTNPTGQPLPLQPCPAVTVRTGADTSGGELFAQRSLNCDRAPAILGPGESVDFAQRDRLPDGLYGRNTLDVVLGLSVAFTAPQTAVPFDAPRGWGRIFAFASVPVGTVLLALLLNVRDRRRRPRP